MPKITVLGGCGAVGSVAVRTLVTGDDFERIIIADMNLEKLEELVSELKDNRLSALKFDANDPDSIKETIKGSSVVLNTVGPFYKFGPIILKAVIESGLNYVDVCDDYDATEKILALTEEAKKANVSALIGMGSSPGIANVLIRFCAETLLDEMESVDIYHAHGGELIEGAAVVKHRIHSMEMDIPMFLEGKFTTVNMFEESGIALEENVEFQDVGTYRVYAYPHPETITLPKYFKALKRATNLGLVLPPEYADLIKRMVRLGITRGEPIEVAGHQIEPLEFAVAYIISQRNNLLKKAGITEPFGCLKIVVKGKKDGEPNTFTFSMSSRGQGMGEGTGIPAALGSMLMQQGKIKEKGVLPPEACVVPMELLGLAREKIKETRGEGLPIVIEHIDKDGNINKMSL